MSKQIAVTSNDNINYYDVEVFHVDTRTGYLLVGGYNMNADGIVREAVAVFRPGFWNLVEILDDVETP